MAARIESGSPLAHDGGRRRTRAAILVVLVFAALFSSMSWPPAVALIDQSTAPSDGPTAALEVLPRDKDRLVPPLTQQVDGATRETTHSSPHSSRASDKGAQGPAEVPQRASGDVMSTEEQRPPPSLPAVFIATEAPIDSISGSGEPANVTGAYYADGLDAATIAKLEAARIVARSDTDHWRGSAATSVQAGNASFVAPNDTSTTNTENRTARPTSSSHSRLLPAEAVGRRPPRAALLFAAHRRTASAPAGNLVKRLPGFGSLFESLPSPVCAAFAELAAVEAEDRGVHSLMNASSDLWQVGLRSRRQWPWRWTAGGVLDIRQFCGKTGLPRQRFLGSVKDFQLQALKPPAKYQWVFYDRNASLNTRFWVLENVAMYRGRYFVDDAVLAPIREACTELDRVARLVAAGILRADAAANATQSMDAGMVAACGSIDTGNDDDGVFLNFAGYFSFNPGEWPRVKQDRLYVEPLSAAPDHLRDSRLKGYSISVVAAARGIGRSQQRRRQGNTSDTAATLTAIAGATAMLEGLPKTALRTAPAAMWVPPVEFKFSFHFVADWLLMGFHSVRHRSALGLDTWLFLSEPKTTRYGFHPDSCKHGAERCLDGGEGVHSKAHARSDWVDFALSIAGGRGGAVGLDREDRDGARGYIAGEFYLGGPTHCEPSLGREGPVLAVVPHTKFTVAQADCARLYWEWRRAVARFLDARTRRKGGSGGHIGMVKWVGGDATRARALYDGAAVTKHDPVVLVLIVRKDATSRRLLNADALIRLLTKFFGPGTAANATIIAEEPHDLHTSFAIFSVATVVIAVHGAGLVNSAFLRPNSGLVVLDTRAPPMAPMVPPWVHLDSARLDCVAAQKGHSCNAIHAFHDVKLSADGGLPRVVDAVQGILELQMTGLDTMVVV